MTNPTVVAGLAEAYAPCTPAQRTQANRYVGDAVKVGGRDAVLQAYIPITGQAIDRIKVTFPEDVKNIPAAPSAMQALVDALVFQAHP